MKCSTGRKRFWLLFVLAIAAVGLMIASSVMPWWVADISPPSELGYEPFSIKVYQYGIPLDTDIRLEYKGYLSEDITPLYQSVLAWIYIGISGGLILLSTFLKGNKGRWLLGAVGLGYIAYVVVAIFVVVSNRIADVGISLTGWSSKVYVDVIEVTVTYFTSLQPGYYLAYAAGGLCIVLALLRNKVVGESLPIAF